MENLREAFVKGVQERKEKGDGVHIENPYPMPFFLSTSFHEYDAFDAGQSGQSWESFTEHKFYRG